MEGSAGTVSREDWIAFANVLPTFAFELAPDGAIRFVNDRFYEATGIARDAAGAVDAAWRSIVHPDDLALSLRRIGAAAAAGEAFENEMRLRAADGSYRLFRSLARPARDARGAIVAWYGISTDMEERERARRSLAVSERALQTLLQAIPQIVWTADATGWIDWYNDRWFEYTGQTPDEAAGWGWQNAHHPDDFLRVMEAWPRSIETGERFEMEFRLRGRDGTFHWFLTRIEPLRDAAGTIVRWYGSNTDIEEQKRAQERAADVVRTLQQAVLPERLPTHDRLRFDGVYVAAGAEGLVGGDWYDATALPDGRFLISCGEVEGHGVEASASVGRLRQSILFAALDARDPAEILRRVNRVLRVQSAISATCVVALLDPRDLSLTYALAGHPEPIVALAPQRAHALPPADAPPLGVVDDFVTDVRAIALATDAVVAFYSDGLLEFGGDGRAARARLLEVVGELVGDVASAHPAQTLRAAVMRGATSRDDVAALVVQCSSIDVAALDDARSPLIKRWRFHSSDARTAQASRRELMAFLETLAGAESDVYAAELVLGEILANTVEHAPGLVEITIDWTGEFPELATRDHGPGMAPGVSPSPAVPLDPLAEDGRGLFLIAALAREVHVESPRDGGTRIVASLPLRRRARGALVDEVA